MADFQNTSGAFIDNTRLNQQRMLYVDTVDAISLVLPEARDYFPVSQSVQLQVLEDFIAYAKKALYQNGVQSPGIGFVFAQYGDEGTDPEMNPLYANKIHIVMKAVDMGLLDAGGTSGVNFGDKIANQPGIKALNFMNISPPKAPIVII